MAGRHTPNWQENLNFSLKNRVVERKHHCFFVEYSQNGSVTVVLVLQRFKTRT